MTKKSKIQLYISIMAHGDSLKFSRLISIL